MVSLARRDRLSSLRQPGRISVAMGVLFGKRPNPRLADPKLEALRRLAVHAWHQGFAVPVSAVKGFQEKREIPVTGEVDQRTWDRLAAMTRTPTQAELDNKPAPPPAAGKLDPRCLTGRVMCIDKSSNKLSWVVDGKVVNQIKVPEHEAKLARLALDRMLAIS